MRLIKPSFEILAMSLKNKLPYSYNFPLELIEAAGRTCYKSEDKIKSGSCVAFYEMLKSKGHYAMIEHSWQIKKLSLFNWRIFQILWSLIFNRFLNVSFATWKVFIAGNIRAFQEWKAPNKAKAKLRAAERKEEDMLYEKKKWKMFAATVRMICDRGVTHEWVRHRPPAFAQESTRWCDYSRGVTFIIPPWVNIPEGEYPSGCEPPKFDNMGDNIWYYGCRSSGFNYLSLDKFGWTPERRRNLLINSLKTEIVTTADLEEWRHIFRMRAVGTSGKPHPQMLELTIPMLTEFYKQYPECFGDLQNLQKLHIKE